MRKRLKVLTVGCKANFADSVSIARTGAACGFRIVSGAARADVVVVNSCTVTHRADRDSRVLARRARRENPGATIILAGCYAQSSSRTGIPEVDRWAGIEATAAGGDARAPLAGILRELAGHDEPGPRVLSEFEAGLLLGRRRTVLKIQDGCDFSCAYCAVPLARGGSRSEPEEEIIGRAKAAEDEGARELVLTGIHIGLYGAESGKPDALAGLVTRLLDATCRLRIRLSSIEPAELTPKLIETVAGSRRVCAHLHVPLQSGCDRTLVRMGRPYRAAEYERNVGAAAARISGLCLGSDVIAGFPGETPRDFEETVRLLQDSPLSYLHVFPYSARPGTASSRMPDDVTAAEKKRRVARLRAVDAAMRQRFRARQIGERLEVLAESADDGRGEVSGRSGNYQEVCFAGTESDLGELHTVIVVTERDGCLTGIRRE